MAPTRGFHRNIERSGGLIPPDRGQGPSYNRRKSLVDTGGYLTTRRCGVPRGGLSSPAGFGGSGGVGPDGGGA